MAKTDKVQRMSIMDPEPIPHASDTIPTHYVNVRMLESIRGATDGRTVRMFEKGNVYRLPAAPSPKHDLGRVFLDQGWAKEVSEAEVKEIEAQQRTEARETTGDGLPKTNRINPSEMTVEQIMKSGPYEREKAQEIFDRLQAQIRKDKDEADAEERQRALRAAAEAKSATEAKKQQ